MRLTAAQWILILKGLKLLRTVTIDGGVRARIDATIQEITETTNISMERADEN